MIELQRYKMFPYKKQALSKKIKENRVAALKAIAHPSVPRCHRPFLSCFVDDVAISLHAK